MGSSPLSPARSRHPAGTTLISGFADCGCSAVPAFTWTTEGDHGPEQRSGTAARLVRPARAADRLRQGRASPKPPPWQVPKPELRPDLLNEPVRPGGPVRAGPGEATPRRRAARKKRSQRRTVVVGLGVTALLAGTITADRGQQRGRSRLRPGLFQRRNRRARGRHPVRQQQLGRPQLRGLRLVLLLPRRQRARPWARTAPPTRATPRTVPSGAKSSTGYSTKGGTVSRGGFGSSSKSGGSTGG